LGRTSEFGGTGVLWGRGHEVSTHQLRLRAKVNGNALSGLHH
jgi:hypothetical protein